MSGSVIYVQLKASNFILQRDIFMYLDDEIYSIDVTINDTDKFHETYRIFQKMWHGYTYIK